MKFGKLLIAAALFFSCQARAQNARVQIIHNSPDTLLQSVDVWVDTMKVLENFSFREGSGFMDLPASTLMQVKLTPANSADTSSAVYRKAINLGAGESYYMVVNGLLDPAMYDPNPNGVATMLDVDIIPQARDTSQVAGNMQFRFAHGIPDYDSANVRISGQLNYLVEPQIYRQFSDWKTLPPALYTFTVYRDTSYDEVFNFQVLLSDFADSALFFISSGLFKSIIDTALPKMGVLVVTSGGQQAFYEGFPTSIKKALNAPGWAVYPNPVVGNKIKVKGPANLAGKATVEIFDGQGKLARKATRPLTNGKLEVDRGTLPEGLYLLKVQAGNQLFTSRIKL